MVKLRSIKVTTLLIVAALIMQLGLGTSKAFAGRDNNVWTKELRVLCSKKIDINKDGEDENIILFSKYKSACGQVKGFKLSVTRANGTQEVISQIDVLKNKVGSEDFSNIYFGDIDNDGVLEIFIQGSPGYFPECYSVCSFKNNKLAEIPRPTYSNKMLTATVVDGDKVEIIVQDINKKFVVPLTQYQELLYKQNSQEPRQKLFSFGEEGSYRFEDVDNDRVYELVKNVPFYAKEYNAVCEIELIYKYNNSSWKLVDAKLSRCNVERTIEDKKKNIITDKDLAIGSVKLGMNYSGIVAAMGKPNILSMYQG